MRPSVENNLAAIDRGLARRRLLRFIIVGAGANFLLLLLTYALLRLGLPTFLAGSLGYAVAFCAAYLAQRAWTFEGRHRHGSALPRYVVAQLACAVVASLVGQVCADIFAMAPLATSVAVAGTAGVTSYFMSSRWVFRGRKPATVAG
jgi:putative flippase GtrA